MSNSSLSSFFSASASPWTRDSMASFSGNSLTSGTSVNSSGSSVNSSGTSVSDTVRNSATITPTSSLSSMSEILPTSSTTSNFSNLLSVSLSLDTIGSRQSKSSIIAVPPCPVKVSKARVQNLVDLKSSPFVRRKKFTIGLSDEQEPKPVITTPTPTRLRSLMKEKLYIAGWINKVDGRYIPEHTPWEFEDVFAPMPWIPEGSLVSKSRFHEVRREQRPRSCSPPLTPPAACGVLPLDVLPFAAIVPLSTEGPTLKRAATFHPGGSQRLRREALVIDGKVTIDSGFKLRSRSLESIASSPSQPNKMDLVIRQLDSGQQSGLERLKNSMLGLMKAQSHRRYPEATNGEAPRLIPTLGQDKIAEETPHGPLAARRGRPVPSALKLVSTRHPPLVSPYHLDVPTPFRGSPSAATPLVTGFPLSSGADKRESINIEDMCTNLRHLVSPIVPNSGKEGNSPQIDCSVVAPADALEDAVIKAPLTPVDDWNFVSELEGTYGDNPFSYFDPQERLPSFVRPTSIAPDVVMGNTGMKQSSGSSATFVPAFPEPPTEPPSIPYIAISGDGLVSERLSSQTWSSLQSSATASYEDLSHFVNEVQTRATVSSTETSPRSSEDRNEPLAIRRLTLLARSSVAMLQVKDFSSSRNFFSPSQETSKPPAKIVRFAPETEQTTSLGNPEVSCPPCESQRPRSSSAPPPQKSSIRNQTFLQSEDCKHDRLSRSQPATLPSRIPKMSPLPRIGTHGQHPVTRNTLTRVRPANENKKRPSPLIPAAGLKATYAPFPPGYEKADDEKRAIDRNSRLYLSPMQPSRAPTPQSAQPQQKTLLSTSWSMTLRQYVKGGDPHGEKRKIPHPQSTRRRGELNPPLNSSVGTKSLLPVKKASFFRDGVGKVTSLSGARGRIAGRGRTFDSGESLEESIIGSVDKTGGISYIAPPKVRETRSQSQGRAKGERQGPSTAETRTLRPGQLRNLLGRFAT